MLYGGWLQGRVHDGVNGAVSGAMISFDHQYLVSYFTQTVDISI